jgi:CotS family spore coat protein
MNHRDLLHEGEVIFQSFPYQMKDIELIKGDGGSRKAVWKVTTPKGEFALKRSHYPLEKLLFSIYAQRYVHEKGARVPKVLNANDNKPYVNKSGIIYMAYPWLPNSRNPDFAIQDDLRETLKGLALFHRASEGYVPPVTCNENWLLDKGMVSYHTLYQEALNMYEQAKGLGDERKKVLLQYLPYSFQLIEDAIWQLERAGYEQVLRMAREKRFLTHEDFGPPNALMAGNKGYVIDMDGTAYNLPIRDFQKIAFQMFKKHGINSTDLRQMISWYEQESPLSWEQKKIMIAEMTIPTYFFGVLRAMLSGRRNISARKIDEVIQFEKSKEAVLRDIRL